VEVGQHAAHAEVLPAEHQLAARAVHGGCAESALGGGGRGHTVSFSLVLLRECGQRKVSQDRDECKQGVRSQSAWLMKW
jgi:hypothetical protein